LFNIISPLFMLEIIENLIYGDLYDVHLCSLVF
jgi:hypothetical protein